MRLLKVRLLKVVHPKVRGSKPQYFPLAVLAIDAVHLTQKMVSDQRCLKQKAIFGQHRHRTARKLRWWETIC